MLNNFISWFKALSAAGKTGVVAAALVTGGVGASAINTSPRETVSQEPECISTSSKDTETETIEFETEEVNDASLAKGKTKIRTEGVNGKKELTYKTTLYDPEDCSENKTELIKEEVTEKPIKKIIAVGTYIAPKPEPEPRPSQASNCNPNYSGCVPNASDVDCAGGSGNGPAYVNGPVTVTGYDIYGLDADGDGVGCE